MNGAKWQDWFEVVGIAGIIVSLIFVGWQLRQERLLMRAELAADSFTNMNHFHLRRSEPGFAAAFAKATQSPEDLTDYEKIQVDAYYDAFVELVWRECFLVRIEVFVECEGFLTTTGATLFASEYGQTWWRNYPLAQEFPGSVNEVVLGLGEGSEVREIHSEN